ncbi:hypothetical protein KGY77_10535 [Candidatus Bipolaricaulota bacterium]|nr:hypothetical protein [Candidatus Bipolaricaulota bacterium]
MQTIVTPLEKILQRTNLFLVPFVNQQVLPDLMQTLAIGLITITIALAIFLAENGTIVEFDRIVIWEKIVQGKFLLTSLSFLLIPLFFWDLSSSIVKFLLFIIYIVGVVGFLSFLFRSYKWIEEWESKDRRIEGYRQEKRLEFLDGISADQQGLIVWEHVWQLENKSFSEEKTYVEKFISNISSFLDTNNQKAALDFLSLFEDFLNDLTLSNIVIFETIFGTLLNWHKRIFNIGENAFQQRQLQKKLEQLTKYFIEKGFFSDEILYSLFEELQDHVSSEDKDYKKQFIKMIAPTFFENSTHSPDSHTIWSSFPSEWKVTEANIVDSQYNTANAWFESFIDWARQRILQHRNQEGEWDKKLEGVTEGLFPFVDPITWSIILTFILGVRNVKEFIEAPRSFGFMSRVHYSWGNESRPREEMEEEENQAIELALLLFKREFSRKNLKKYIGELEQLSYEKEDQEDRRKQLKSIFENMLKRLEKTENG